MARGLKNHVQGGKLIKTLKESGNARRASFNFFSVRQFFSSLGHLLMLELCRNGAVMYYAKINSEYQTKKFEGEGLNFHSETWLNIFFVNWKNHFSLILSTFKLFQECGMPT